MDREEIKKKLMQAYELYSAEDYNKAFPLFVQGAEAGFLPAYVIVGDCYWNGNGVEADRKKAILYYLTAADAGYGEALMRMGDFYLRCNNPQKAIDTFVEATEKGEIDAYFNLGSIYYYGAEGIERNLSVAATFFEKYISLISDNSEAFFLLGRCYVFMKNSNLSKAEEMFRISASLGNQKAAKDYNTLQLGGHIIDIF